MIDVVVSGSGGDDDDDDGRSDDLYYDENHYHFECLRPSRLKRQWKIKKITMDGAADTPLILSLMSSYYYY